MSTTILIIFLVGYLFIAFENLTKVNKSGIALLMSVVCWAVYMMTAESNGSSVFASHVADTCETILFLMGAMTIVEVVDYNGGFSFVTNRLKTDNAKALLWKTVCLTFVLSALLDNMTTCIVMIMVLKKLVADKHMRMLYAGMVVIAANAGGAFSPIGDVTTIMLWIKGCVSATGIIMGLLIPSIVCVVVPTMIVSTMIDGNMKTTDGSCSADDSTSNTDYSLSHSCRVIIFLIGVVGLISVPGFHTLTGLPPFVGVMGVLAVLWISTEIMIGSNKRLMHDDSKVRVASILHKIDISTILFFLGILLTVGALQETGLLNEMGIWLDHTFGNVYIVNAMIGIVSSVVDNVPLVAGAMGMYPIESADAVGALQAYAQDGTFWQLLAFCAGTGGSILIIGSAAGVIAMGLENISFGWYLKRFSWIALLGYFAGIATYWLMNECLCYSI